MIVNKKVKILQLFMKLFILEIIGSQPRENKCQLCPTNIHHRNWDLLKLELYVYEYVPGYFTLIVIVKYIIYVLLVIYEKFY